MLTPRSGTPQPSLQPRGKKMAKARGKIMQPRLPNERFPRRPPQRSSKLDHTSGFKTLREPCMLDSDAELEDELEFIAKTGKNSERAVRAMQLRDRAAQNGERSPEESYSSHQRNVLRRQRAVGAAEESHR